MNRKFDAEAVIERGNRAKSVSELDRLSFVVREIENDCAVVPYSSYFTTPNDEIRLNTQFKGLSLEEIKS